MDPIDILGSLLGSGKPANTGGSTGGLGGKILSELLKGGKKNSPPTAAPPKASIGSRRPADRDRNIDQQAEELEELLGVARGRHTGQQSTTTARQPPVSNYSPAPSPSKFQQPSSPTKASPDIGFTIESPNTRGRSNADQHSASSPKSSLTQEDEAIVLIRAMINAAKADGRVTQAEQKAILDRLADTSQDAMQFMRNEFSTPLDVRDFAWSVPLGMEQQVYLITLATIDLDTTAEANYLRDLAHGLRLDPEVCNQIHQRYGAPTLF